MSREFGMTMGDTFVSTVDGVRYKAVDYAHEYQADHGDMECKMIFRNCDSNVEYEVAGYGRLRADSIEDAFRTALVALKLRCLEDDFDEVAKSRVTRVVKKKKKKTRAVMTCGKCGKLGHNRRGCRNS